MGGIRAWRHRGGQTKSIQTRIRVLSSSKQTRRAALSHVYVYEENLGRQRCQVELRNPRVANCGRACLGKCHCQVQSGVVWQAVRHQVKVLVNQQPSQEVRIVRTEQEEHQTRQGPCGKEQCPGSRVPTRRLGSPKKNQVPVPEGGLCQGVYMFGSDVHEARGAMQGLSQEVTLDL